jgi:L-seryl-tRNA(Ser) seleniumtransferase
MSRSIPSIEQLRQHDAFRGLEAAFGRTALVDALRAEADHVRQQLKEGPLAGEIAAVIERGVRARLEASYAPSLHHAINATGVIVHTNLGRAPLAASAAERVARLATGYTNLEYDVREGRRGRRDVHAERLICRLTSAEAAVVVNNNAAATLVSLAALAAGREVIISRGELVEIGGGFRVPDVMANRTRAADYAAAIGDRTALILRVHPSNFRVEGFTERPTLADLVAIGRRFNVPIAEDLGSGFLGVPDGIPALRDEPVVSDSIRAGADVVTFSGDKLLGGPQAGIIAGTRASIDLIRRHPLMRALRTDKMAYAALEATLEEYSAGRATETVPVAAMIAMSADEIGRRANTLASELAAAGIHADVVDGFSTIGGGSAPGTRLPTRLVAIALPAERLESSLRARRPPVIARIENGRVLLDLRTVPVEVNAQLASLVIESASSLLP